ncbi:hypothetical protein LP037_063 [Listeria phage LP-037]|uniref:Uncharacterized protein n=2 Tax=Homburgvirus TaxID=1921125 RepID=S4UAC1_9CAUD|nr:hypothetical protein LP037_063 [Listeria phage LP-037]YP_009045128.1 hypothetical protein LP114_074 [Listeria phage LP-114]AGI11678.1 hypothetical protein LP037_063 [Listeria phage LP-037]AHL18662.1 hypothetical protein LP114_074 [Listeria phage LP-114]
MGNLKPAIPDMYVSAVKDLYMDNYFNESSTAITKIIIGYSEYCKSTCIGVTSGDYKHVKLFGEDGITLHIGEVVWN